MKKFIHTAIYVSLAFALLVSCKKEDANPLSVTITNPQEGEDILLGTTVTIVAEDERGNLSEVRFYIDGVGKAYVSEFPYNYEWNTTGEENGIHSIMVTAFDDADNQISDEISINLLEYTPDAIFSGTPTSTTIGDIVQFTDQSSNYPTSWLWDFGDEVTSTSQNPTHSYSSVGTYTVSLTATNGNGSDTEIKTGFISVSDIEFNSNLTYGSVTDIEGNTYKTIQIGSQIWMAENLKTTRYNDSTPIPNVTDNTAWGSLSSAAYCWYENDIDNKIIYGAIYNWYTVNESKLCPTGWHIPDSTEWTTLADYYGGNSVAGGKLKETGTAHWNSPNTSATNESGFTALPGGWRYNNLHSGNFDAINGYGVWWTGTQFNTDKAYYRSMRLDNSYLNKTIESKSYGYSVRCIKD